MMHGQKYTKNYLAKVTVEWMANLLLF